MVVPNRGHRIRQESIQFISEHIDVLYIRQRRQATSGFYPLLFMRKNTTPGQLAA